MRIERVNYIWLFVLIFGVIFIVGSVGRGESNEFILSKVNLNCDNLDHGAMIDCLQKYRSEQELPPSVEEKIQALSQTTEWQVPEEFSKMQNPFVRDESSIGIGEGIFSFYCAGCHGAKGLGDGEYITAVSRLAPPLNSDNIKSRTDGELLWKITAGKWPMPAFWGGDTISEADLWHLINFVRTLSFQEKE